MKRILVIGAKGMLGRDLMEELHSSFGAGQSSGWEVIGWDIEEIDIQEVEPTVTKIESLHPTTVINLAAYTDVDGCESEIKKAFAVNAEGMRHVALGSLKSRAKVVYLSTDYVFDGGKKKPYSENDPPHPLNVYGRSKLRGEEYVRELLPDAVIVRTQWLFGKHGKNFVASILRQAQEKKRLSIVDDQIGSPTYTVDLSKAISALLKSDARGIFHVANSEFCSWFTFGQTILELSGIKGVKVVPISTKELGRPAVRPSYSILNTEKLRNETGIHLRSWSEALKEYLSCLSPAF